MFNTKCACGKSNKNFKYNIGPFYVEDCCRAAGYDEIGKRVSSGDSIVETLTKALKSEAKPVGPADLTEIKNPTINMVADQARVPSDETELSLSAIKPTLSDRILKFLGSNSKKLTKSKLENLRVDEIKQIASDRAIEGHETMTRAQLTDVLLKQNES